MKQIYLNIYTNEFVKSDKHHDGLVVPCLVRQGNKLVHLERDRNMKLVIREVPKELYS